MTACKEDLKVSLSCSLTLAQAVVHSSRKVVGVLKVKALQSLTPTGGITVTKTDPTDSKDNKKSVPLGRRAVYPIISRCCLFHRASYM